MTRARLDIFRPLSRFGFLARCFFSALLFLCAVLSVPEARAEPIATRQLAEGVTIEIMELRRITPKILSLTYAVRNETEESLAPGDVGLAYGGNMNTIILLDLKNLKQYTVGKGGAGCLCSKQATVPPGGRVEFWAHFAAPKGGVTKLAIQFAVAPPLFDIPIAK